MTRGDEKREEYRVSDLAACPHCGVSLQGEPIPYGHATHYRREIGVELSGVYDGVLYWQCPNCSGRWHRFPEGHYLRERAEPFVAPLRRGAA